MSPVPMWWCNTYFWQEVFALLARWIRQRPLVGVGLASCGLLLVCRLMLVVVAVLFSTPASAVTDVSGRISLDGMPVSEGTIQFLPRGGGQPASAKIRDGLFKATKVPVGPCRLVCVAIKETGTMMNEGGHVFPERVSLVPEPYRDGIDVTIDRRQAPLALDWRRK